MYFVSVESFCSICAVHSLVTLIFKYILVYYFLDFNYLDNFEVTFEAENWLSLNKCGPYTLMMFDVYFISGLVSVE